MLIKKYNIIKNFKFERFKSFSLIIDLLIIFLIVIFSTPLIFTQDLWFGYKAGDPEINSMIGYSIKNGGKLYQDFSIVYPPGRYLLLSLIYNYTEFSIPIFHIYYLSFGLIFFPIMLYFFSKEFLKLLRLNNNYIIIILSFLATICYLLFIRGAQEIHFIIALYFWYLIKKINKNSYPFNFFLGFIFGLTYWFRIDGGIILTLSLLISIFLKTKKNFSFNFIKGLLVSIFILILTITIKGSFSNFVFDMYLGIIEQPKQMSLSIQPELLNTFLFFIFLSFNIFFIGTFITNNIIKKELKYNKNKPLFIDFFSTHFFSYLLLQFVNSLGRSDEAHLYYVNNFNVIILILLPFFYNLIKNKKIFKINKFSIYTIF